MKKLLFACLGVLSFSAYSQVIVKDFNVNVDTREDNLPASSILRTQDRVRMGFTIDANGIVDIVGVAATGPSFNNDWNTFITQSGKPDNMNIAFRNLYLKKVMGKTTAELGALSPEPVVGSAGLGASGWMDGARVKVNTKIGDIKVVAGSLGDFSQPNAFARKFKGNFIEVELSKELFGKLMTQSAIQEFNGDVYAQEQAKFDLKVLGDKVFHVFAGALYNFQKESYNCDLGVEFDLLKTIVNKYDDRLDVKLYFSNVSTNLPDQYAMISAIQSYGPRATMQVSGKIDKANNITWFTRASLSKSDRFDVGLNIKIPAIKPKPVTAVN